LSEGIQDELDAYNPLVPNGNNLKATLTIEYGNPTERAEMLEKLCCVEDKIYVKVEGHPAVYAIADEDMDRSNDVKTAAVHFLRSVTKMFTGDTAYAGNPPPVLNFNAYGDHVFRNVPVVVKSFSMSLPKDTNYISTNLASGSGFGLDSISQTSNALSFGVALLGANSVSSSLSKASNVVSAGSSIIRGLGLSGSAGGQSSAGDSYVPVKSDLTVTLMPVYSRQNVRQFSLQQFVNGAYVGKGYI
jgi:hypothetical protein